MRILQGGDVSNFSSPLDAQQQAYVNANWQRVCIGLQDAGRARGFQRQFANLDREYYMERPNRDLSIPEPNSWIWIDVEPGCIVTADEIRQCKALILAQGLRPCLYGNETSILPVIGNSTEFSDMPLILANYGTPDLNRVRSFNGFKIRGLQYSSDGVAGINCDLDIWIDEEENELANLNADGSDRIVSENGMIVVYHQNVPVLRIGGETPGQLSKLFGDKYYSLAHTAAPDGHNAPVVFSDTLTD